MWQKKGVIYENYNNFFNFIVTILEAAMKSSPSVCPIEATKQRNKEINDLTSEIWSQIHEPCHYSHTESRMGHTGVRGKRTYDSTVGRPTVEA